jgi:hypothetical protein
MINVIISKAKLNSQPRISYNNRPLPLLSRRLQLFNRQIKKSIVLDTMITCLNHLQQSLLYQGLLYKPAR